MSKPLILKLRLTTFLVLIFSGLTLTPLGMGFPGDKPSIIVEPTTLKDSTITPGSSFTISIRLYNVTTANVPTGLQGVEVKLTWDNTILNLTSRSHMLGQPGGVLNPTILIGKDEVGANYYWLAGASTGNPWWGNGVIANVTFKVLATGKTSLTLSFTDLVDTNIESIDHYVQSGTFDNRPPAPPVIVYVDPSKIVDPSLTPSSSFNVSVKVGGASYLSQLTFTMNFNSDILEVGNANWGSATITGQLSWNNTVGFISGSANSSEPITGNATIAFISFHVKALGESTLQLSNITIKDALGGDLAYTSADGYFNNQLVTKIYVDPSYLIDPNLRPGNTVTFNITGQNFQNIAYCGFNFSFNPNIVKIIGYIVNPINGTVVDSEVTINNTFGTMLVKISYQTPINFNKENLMGITFQIRGYGMSPLNISDTTLLDAAGLQVPHQVENGLLITVIRDVAVIDIQPTPTMVYPRRIVTVNVIVKNLGNLTESFTVSAFVDNQTLLGTLNVENLATGANATLTFQWNTTGLEPCHWHYFWANASIVPYEIDISNNSLTGPVQVKIKIYGDINGDGKVDLSDLALFAKSYYRRIGDPLYNPDTDIDGNGFVNLVDLVTMAFHYNKSC
jgi:hypothetical protein